MQRLGMLGRARDVRLHDFEDEVVVLGDEAAIRQPAFEAGMAFGGQRGVDLVRLMRRQLELLELVDLRPGCVADPDHLICERRRRKVDDAFLAAPDQTEAMVAAGDHAADQGRRELHYRMPAHGHDVALVAMRRCDQHDRSGFQVAPDPGDRQVDLATGARHVSSLGWE